MSTAIRSHRLVPSLLALAALGAGASAADPTVTIISPSTGAIGSSSTVVFKVDWGTDVAGFDPLNAGYDAVTTTTLGAAIVSASATSITLSSGTGIAVGTVLKVGTELMKVTGSPGTTPTVERGIQGSTAATALIGAAVEVHNWVAGDMMLYQSLSTLNRTAPSNVTPWNLATATDTTNDGVFLMTVADTTLSTSNVDVSAQDRIPTAKSSVFTVTLDASADQLYLQLPQGKSFTADTNKTASPSGSGAYNSAVLLYQKLPAAPVFSYADVTLPASAAANAYDGSLSATPSVNLVVNVNDDEVASAEDTATLNTNWNSTTSTTLTLSADLSSSVTANETVLQIESEQVLITKVTTNVGADDYTVVRGYNGTTAALHDGSGTAIKVYKVASVINPKVGTGLSWTARVRDSVSGAVVGSTTFTKKSSGGTVANNTVGRQTVTIPITTALSKGQHALVVEVLDGAGQVVAPGATMPAVVATLGGGGINSSATSVTVSNTAIPTGAVIQIEGESMLVTAGGGSTSLTVTRGYAGTTAAAHANATSISMTHWGNVVVWDAPTLTVNGAPVAAGGTVQSLRSNDLVFAGSRFNSVADTRKSVISLKVDGGNPTTSGFVSTTLGAAVVSTSATTVTVASNTNISIGTVLYIDSEQMLVSAISGTTITVTRGANGTTAATHSSGATVTGTYVDTANSLTATTISVSTTLGAAITSTSATSITVASATGIDVGSVALVGTEKMLVTAVSGTTLTVTRGYDGTTAATAINGAGLTVAAANTSFRFDLSKLPAATKHVLTLTQTYDADNGSDVDAVEPQVVQTYYLDTSTVADTIAPASPTITSPADGGTLTSTKPTITGLAEPGSKIKIVATATDGSGTVTLDYPVTANATTGAFTVSASDWGGSSLTASKTYTFQAMAKDSANNESALTDSDFTVVMPSAAVNPTMTPSSANVTNATDGNWWAKSGDIVFTTSFTDLTGAALNATTGSVAGLNYMGQLSGRTLGAAITSTTATSITVDATTGMAVGSVLLIDTEYMVVTALTNATTVAVTRGAFSSTAATHSNGATVNGSSGPYTDFTVSTGASIKDVAISGNNIVVTVSPGTSTSVSLSLAAGTFTIGGTDNQAASAVSVSRDVVVPTVTAKLQPTIGSSTTGIGYSFQVVLSASEPIYTVDTAQALTFTGGGGWTLGTPTSSVSVDKKTVTLSYTASGGTPTTVVLTTVPAALLKDVASNPNASTSITGQSRVFDNTAPTVTITSTAATVGKVAPIPFAFTFSESVVDFDKTKILLTNGVLQSITGTGALYTVNVMPGEGPTAVKVEFASGATVTDGVGKVSASLSGGASGVSYLTRTYDSTTPRVISLTSSTAVPTSTDAKPTNKTSIPCSIVFSEALSTTTPLATAAFTVENGTISGLSGSGSAYTFNVDVTNPVTEPEKKIRVVLQAGKVQDSAGNANSAVAVLVRNFDGKAPTLTFSTPTLGGSDAASANSTAQFVINVDGASVNYTSGDVFLSKLDVTKLGISEGVISSVVAKRANGATLTDDSNPIATIEVNVTGVNRAPGKVVTLSVGAGLVKDRASNSSAATSKDLVVPGAG